MLELLLIFGGAALVGGGFFVLRKRKGGREASASSAPAPVRDRTPMTLRPGDIVGHLGTDYLVRARNVWDEEGFRWNEYELEDGPRERRLIVALDDRMRLYFLAAEPELASYVGENPADQMEVGLVRYRLVERGAAKVRRETESRPSDAPPHGAAGSSGAASATASAASAASPGGNPAEEARYWEYGGPGGKIAYVVRKGGQTFVWIGEEIRNEAMLELYPGS